jgi:serine/threonine protein kinase
MPEVAERAWFFLCSVLGRLLRSAKYSKTRIVDHGGASEVRKRRALYAPPLVWLSGPLVRLLNTGQSVLAQRDWEERERLIYRDLGRTPTRVEGRTLVLPRIAGVSLAALLEKPELDPSVRNRSILLAIASLAELHSHRFTHGDAMAENVLVDLGADVAHWIDFETVHDPDRPLTWCRADDVRALLATCVLRTAPDRIGETVHLIVDSYADEAVTRLLAEGFRSVMRRPLIFHLGQASLSIERYRATGRLLGERACAFEVDSRRPAAHR